ncbi:MAG: phosphatidate cytidylyltransferase [Deferribacteraceae bacterium]|jgi:phosphatidate cytidylyltransferase|nr:phosphatidate cytidylyltransferase [Deferribacteraceae bacterium]
MSELIKRVIVSAALIPAVVLLTLWENTIPFAAGVYLIILLGNKEIIPLMRKAGEPVTPAIAWLGALTTPICFYFTDLKWVLFAFVMIMIIFVAFITKLFSGDPAGGTIRYVSSNIFAAVFFPMMFSFIWLLRELPNGSLWLFYLFVAIWASDIFAYFVGSKIGRRKIIPKISPKKSLEGFIAGITGGTGLAILFYCLFIAGSDRVPFIMIIIMSVDIVAAGILGDLFESMMKRNAQIKDSGALIPGHGGILDRIDSILFAAPVLYVYLYMYVRIWGGA